MLDPTCGSGTTAYVAEQWGRRWITIDTSRVALALARARIMGARYPYYLLADSAAGQRKEAEISGAAPKDTPTHNDIRQGFVYERVPHITLKSIANNAEIDVIWERWQEVLEPLRQQLNAALGKSWGEWEIPREAAPSWPAAASKLHAEWWSARIERQKEIDASIGAKAEFEYLYDKPYPDPSRIRVAGPFTVESLSPHRVLAVDADDSLIDQLAENGGEWGDKPDFAQMVLEKSQDRRRAAGAQGRPHRLHLPGALAGRADRRRGPLHGGRSGAPRRHFPRPGIRHRRACRSRRRGARGGGRPVRCRDRLRLQFRRPFRRV